MTTRRTARLDWAVVLPLMLMTGDAVAMDTFQDLRRALEAIAVEKTADPNRLGALLGGTFRPTTAEMPYHTVYRGVMEPESAFSGCELRLPKSPQATSALVTCTVSPKANLRRAEVQQAYNGHIQFVPASPRAPKDAPSYLTVTDGTTKISFGIPRSSEFVSTVVIELKTQK